MILSLIALLAVADLDVARQALRDGLWDIARTSVGTNASDEAKLIVLESYASENRWDEVEKFVSTCTGKDKAFEYYRAASAGKYAKAAELLKKNGAVSGIASARMIEADLHLKAGNAAAARQLWREVLAMSNVNERVFATAGINLGDVEALRKAATNSMDVTIRRMVNLRLGVELLKDEKSFEEGVKLVKQVVADSPDVKGGREAYLSLAAVQASVRKWKDSLLTYQNAVEIWPDVARRGEVAQGKGEALFRLGRREEAQAAFVEAEKLSTDDEHRAMAILRQGDALSELGRGSEAMARYRTVLEKYPSTVVAVGLRRIISLRELEMRGRELYAKYQFAEAKSIFEQVGNADPMRKPMMEFLIVHCLYGMGKDDQALAEAKRIRYESTEADVRNRATMWLAKFQYNSMNWKEAETLFLAYASVASNENAAAESMLWAVRSSFASADYRATVKLATELSERYATTVSAQHALIIQGESLIELARFDEAALVLERVANSQQLSLADRAHAEILKADALFAMGADNQARYVAALSAYRAVRMDGELSPSQKLVIDFKIARTLEKLRKLDEANEQYYAKVIIAYRDGCEQGIQYEDEACAAFLKAALHLSEELESRGRDRQAVSILQLVIATDGQAAAEARRRIERIRNKGRFL